jgi:DNA-binding beta-propeller fold protein YncE
LTRHAARRIVVGDVLYVSYYLGGSVDAIDADNPPTPVLGHVPTGVDLDELRGLAIGPDGLLWVVSGGKKSSQIVRFRGKRDAKGHHKFADLLAATAPGPAEPKLVLDGMVHPYDVAFPPGAGTWFVSCQDTNLVLGPLPYEPPFPKNPPISQYLASLGGSFPAGSFVGSTRVDLPKAPAEEKTPVAPPAGLEVELKKGKPKHSVRGLAHDGKLLYVADEAKSLVKAYQPTGEFLQSWPDTTSGWTLSSPVQLLYDGGSLYIGNSGSDKHSVFCLSGDSATVVAKGISKVSAVALDPSGTLYVGSRTPKSNGKWCVYQVPKGSTTPTQFGHDLDDAPEFLLYVPDA